MMPVPPRPLELPSWVREWWAALPPGWQASAASVPQALAIALLSFLVDPLLFAFTVVTIGLIPAVGIGVLLFPVLARVVRWRTNLHRRLAARLGVEIPIPYRYHPLPVPLGRQIRAAMGDPATWRDFAWLLPSAIISGILATVAFSIPLYGLQGLLGIAVIQELAFDWFGYGPFWPIDGLLEAVLTIPLGAGILAVGLPAARWLLLAEAAFSRFFLGPTRAGLAARVQQLTVTRSESLDAQAAELRRIERDLHDGAQARLVSVGLNIGLAQELLPRDPAAAAELLSEARRSSGEALADLRRLVRGIYPPVLAERGLEGAVRALALTLPVPVTVKTDLPGRAPLPVESAVYFAVAEALANIVKHSQASAAWVVMAYRAGRLSVDIGDNGRGGASLAAGSGLRGVERRLAAFDATMVVTSPPGGPTVIRMEVPCELSSPRTSPSSGTG